MPTRHVAREQREETRGERVGRRETRRSVVLRPAGCSRFQDAHSHATPDAPTHTRRYPDYSTRRIPKRSNTNNKYKKNERNQRTE